MPFANGVTLTGWAVVRSAPWHFAGIYAEKTEAESKAAAMGADYQVRWGDNQQGTDNFIEVEIAK